MPSPLPPPAALCDPARMHACYACDPANPHRIISATGDALTARVPGRFRGPPGAANGGIATGLLACPALRSAGDAPHAATRITARLRQAVPVERDLPVAVTRDGAACDVAVGGAEPVLTGRVELAALDAPVRPGAPLPATAAPEHAAALAGMARVAVPDRPPFYEEVGEHPIPGCFSCGPDNPDGLHIIPRAAADGVVASAWRPDALFDDGGGALAQVIVASALDCSSGICMPLADQRALLAQDQFFLLGTLDVRFLRVPPVAGDYRVVARALGRDGRKFYGLSALFDAAGTPYATAAATWIIAPVPRSEAFGAAS